MRVNTRGPQMHVLRALIEVGMRMLTTTVDGLGVLQAGQRGSSRPPELGRDLLPRLTQPSGGDAPATQSQWSSSPPARSTGRKRRPDDPGMAHGAVAPRHRVAGETSLVGTGGRPHPERSFADSAQLVVGLETPSAT